MPVEAIRWISFLLLFFAEIENGWLIACILGCLEKMGCKQRHRKQNFLPRCFIDDEVMAALILNENSFAVPSFPSVKDIR